MAYFAVSLASTDPEGLLDGGLPSIPIPGSGVGQGCAVNGGIMPHANTPAPWAMPWMPGGRALHYLNREDFVLPKNIAIGGTPGIYPNDRFRPEIVALQYQYITYKSRQITIPDGMPKRIPIKPRRRTIMPGDRPRRCEESFPHEFTCADDATDFTTGIAACLTCNPGMKNPRAVGQDPKKTTKHIWPFFPGSVNHLSCFDGGSLGQSAICGKCCDDSSGFPEVVDKCICR